MAKGLPLARSRAWKARGRRPVGAPRAAGPSGAETASASDRKGPSSVSSREELLHARRQPPRRRSRPRDPALPDGGDQGAGRDAADGPPGSVPVLLRMASGMPWNSLTGPAFRIRQDRPPAPGPRRRARLRGLRRVLPLAPTPPKRFVSGAMRGNESWRSPGASRRLGVSGQALGASVRGLPSRKPPPSTRLRGRTAKRAPLARTIAGDRRDPCKTRGGVALSPFTLMKTRSKAQDISNDFDIPI